MAHVVLPTPPFWFAIAITLPNRALLLRTLALSPLRVAVLPTARGSARANQPHGHYSGGLAHAIRSEERRVGEECRGRCAPGQSAKREDGADRQLIERLPV